MRQRPSNCFCEGRGFKQKGHRWVVLERGEKRSLLKCLECGWKWKSRCKYVAKLSDHVERSRSGMTDEDILERLRECSLLVDSYGAHVLSVQKFRVPGGFRTAYRALNIISRESNGSTYRFVEVCRDGKKKKIALHKLVWMSHHLRVPPDGFDVHHKERLETYPDRYSNLELIDSSTNRRWGREMVGIPF